MSTTGERQFDILPTELLERYYGKYSQSAKAFRTRDIPDTFFRDIAEFLLEVGCTHINAYGMPKHKAGVMLATYEVTRVDWGTVTGAALREGLHAFYNGKKLRPIIQQYFTILFPHAHYLLRRLGRADAVSRKLQPRHGRRTATATPWPHLLDDAPHLHQQVHHPHPKQYLHPPQGKKRRKSVEAHSRNAGGSTARTGKAWQKMQPSR